MLSRGYYWPLLLLPLACGGCASFHQGENWLDRLFTPPADPPASLTPVSSAWNDLGALAPGQTGTTPLGATVRVEGVWQSALGDSCKRLIVTSPAAGTQLICQNRDGWYALRDVAAEENKYVN
jgi:hypothetical protein